MRMLKRVGILALAAALGSGTAIAATGCGEDREGEVQFEDSGTVPSTATAPETTETGTVPTETAP
jgi:hypothetical protein